MKNWIAQSCVALVAVVFVASIAGAQGVTWESESSGGPMPEKETMKNFYMPGMVKVSQKTSDIIFRLDKEKMIMVDKEKKTYSEMTFAELEKAMGKVDEKVNAAMAEAMKQMESMPEEQREMMKKMMGGKFGGMMDEAVVKKTSEKKSINGYDCVKYTVTTGDKHMMTVWTTKDVKEFDSMQKDMREFAKRMAAMTPKIGKSIASAMENLEGFPIQQEVAGISTTVLNIKKENTAKGEFEPPSGFKRVKPEMMEALEKMDDKQ